MHYRFMGQMETDEKQTKNQYYCLSDLLTRAAIRNRYLCQSRRIKLRHLWVPSIFQCIYPPAQRPVFIASLHNYLSEFSLNIFILIFLLSWPSIALCAHSILWIPSCLPAPHLFSHIFLRPLFLLLWTVGSPPFPSASIIYFQFMAQTHLTPPGKPLFIYSQTGEKEL